MGKFSQLAIGARPTKRIPIQPAGALETADVGLRLLSATERSQANQRAQKQAAAAGVEKWDPDNAICALELYVEVVALAAFDVDDPESRDPWATADELRNSTAVGQENLAYLYEAYEAFETEHCIRVDRIGAHEFSDLVWKLASGDQNPLGRLRPGTLWTFMRTLAVQYLTLTNAISLSSSASDSVPSSTPPS